MDKKKNFLFLVFIALLFIVFAFSIHTRLNKLHYWHDDKDAYIAEEYPAMTTLDAYLWLRYAKEYKNGDYIPSAKDSLRFYPDYKKKPNPIPMLSFIIAKLSVFFDISVYWIGIYIIPILASFFIIPLVLYFYILRLPLAGLLGSITCTTSYMYIARTSIGRVDTDALNLFFPLLASFWIVLLLKVRKVTHIYLLSILAGLTMYLFYLWYHHPGFTVVYLIILLGILVIKRVPPVTALISIVLFAIFSNPFYMWEGVSQLWTFITKYILILPASTSNLPNILNTITEAQAKPIDVVLSSMLNDPYVTILGLVCFLISSIFYWDKIVPILPLFLLGMLSFKSSIRFSMFLSPFVGIGYGMILHILSAKIINAFKIKSIIVYTITYIFALLLIVFITVKFSFLNYTPAPSIKSEIIHSFLDIKKLDLGDAKIVSWWDYGYAIEDITGFTTYHDGGTQRSPKTYYIANALTTDSQNTLHNTLSFIENKGTLGISKLLKQSDLAYADSKIINYKGTIKSNNYLLFTKDMIPKYGAINSIGNFNSEIGEKTVAGYKLLRCNSFKNNNLQCRGITIDLNNGITNNMLPIKKAIFIRDGEVIVEYDYGFANGIYIQIILIDKNIRNVYLLPENTYNSNFNKMFFLGKYDKDNFDEIYNKFPSARLYKLK